MRRIISSLVVAAFCVAGSTTFAQLGPVKEGAKKAGTATKEVGKATVETTKEAATAAGTETKKAAGATQDAVQRTYVCADGKTDKATVKTNACKNHGGVRQQRASNRKR